MNPWPVPTLDGAGDCERAAKAVLSITTYETVPKHLDGSLCDCILLSVPLRNKQFPRANRNGGSPVEASVPESLTWHIADDGERPYAICVEPSAESRVQGFLKRRKNLRTIVQPWGHDWTGAPLTAYAKHLMKVCLYKKRRRLPSLPRESVMAVMREACETHGVSVEHIHAPSARRRDVSRAKGYAAHLLKERLRMSTPKIAETLCYKDHSCVRHWLEQPLAVVSTPIEIRKAS